MFLNHISTHRLHPLFSLAFTTGLRRGEIIGLQWEDIEIEDLRLHVCRSIVSVEYELVESNPKTASSRRNISLDIATTGLLQQWKRAQTEERLAAGAAWAKSTRIFTKPDGTSIHPDRVSKVFAQLQTGARVPRITPHQIRYSWAMLALRVGMHPKVVSERLGHSSTQVTLDIYSHVAEDLEREAAATVAELLYA